MVFRILKSKGIKFYKNKKYILKVGMYKGHKLLKSKHNQLFILVKKAKKKIQLNYNFERLNFFLFSNYNLKFLLRDKNFIFLFLLNPCGSIVKDDKRFQKLKEDYEGENLYR